ncbi:hypothetical protein D9M68_489590 [compost metagenome]
MSSISAAHDVSAIPEVPDIGQSGFHAPAVARGYAWHISASLRQACSPGQCHDDERRQHGPGAGRRGPNRQRAPAGRGEPRDPHAAVRHARHAGAAVDERVGRGAAPAGGDHHRVVACAAADARRPARLRAHRSRPDQAGRGAVRSGGAGRNRGARAGAAGHAQGRGPGLRPAAGRAVAAGRPAARAAGAGQPVAQCDQVHRAGACHAAHVAGTAAPGGPGQADAGSCRHRPRHRWRAAAAPVRALHAGRCHARGRARRRGARADRLQEPGQADGRRHHR